jgi:hypothetical protein
MTTATQFVLANMKLHLIIFSLQPMMIIVNKVKRKIGMSKMIFEWLFRSKAERATKKILGSKKSLKGSELKDAMIQSFVFSLLICIQINDALNLH